MANILFLDQNNLLEQGPPYYILQSLKKTNSVIKILKFTFPKIPFENKIIYMSLGYFKKIILKEYIKENSPDLIINPHIFSIYDNFLEGSFTYICYAHRALGYWPLYYINKRMFNILKYPASIHDLILKKRFVRDNFYLLANSFFTLKSYMRFGIRGGVVYYPCKINDITPSNMKKDWIVTIGRISRERMHEVTIEIAKEVPDKHFIIMGSLQDIKYYFELKRLIKKLNVYNVTMLTNVPRTILKSILGKAKVYFNPRFMETFGVSVIEGMAGGCVPVVRDHGALKETVTEDVGFRWNSIEEATEYIKEIFNNRRLYHEKSFNAIERSRLYTPEKFMKRVLRSINNLL